jgi:hypothetical protein
MQWSATGQGVLGHAFDANRDFQATFDLTCGLFVPNPSTCAGCQGRRMLDLGCGVHRCPPASVVGRGGSYSVGYSAPARPSSAARQAVSAVIRAGAPAGIVLGYASDWPSCRRRFPAARRLLGRARDRSWSRRPLGALVVPDSTRVDSARSCGCAGGPAAFFNCVIRQVPGGHVPRRRVKPELGQISAYVGGNGRSREPDTARPRRAESLTCTFVILGMPTPHARPRA